MTLDEEMLALLVEWEAVEAKVREMQAMQRALSADVADASKYAGELRHQMLDKMETVGVLSTRINGCTLSVSAGRPAVVIVNADELPEDFVKVRREPDKTKIGDMLKAGRSVPGAMLSNAMPTLRIGAAKHV